MFVMKNNKVALFCCHKMASPTLNSAIETTARVSYFFFEK
ncbi:hypothetical protein FM106_18285 [Brachybacterium faecium]|nr:hypothetical protein FM106_18285 [Brachybacterium faecium]